MRILRISKYTIPVKKENPNELPKYFNRTER
jgi:hypothetical protein